MEEHPRSRRRMLNVAWKGTAARLADSGLLGTMLDPSRQVQAGLATSALCGILFVAEATKLWAGTMLDWNGSATPGGGIATVSAGVLTLTLAAVTVTLVLGFVVTLVAAFLPNPRRSRRRVLAPLGALLASATGLAFAVHAGLRFVIARGGIEWSDPGIAVKQLAGASIAVVQDLEFAVLSGRTYATLNGTLETLSPLFLLALGVAAMTLIRRMELSPRFLRLGRAAVVILFSLMALFVVTFVIWVVDGGGAGSLFDYDASFPALAFGTLALLSVCSGSCLAHTRPRSV
jgi:hypothetical protein